MHDSELIILRKDDMKSEEICACTLMDGEFNQGYLLEGITKKGDKNIVMVTSLRQSQGDTNRLYKMI